nr:MAG TPA: hypothetical protein [Caudoviricetes sp.]
MYFFIKIKPPIVFYFRILINRKGTSDNPFSLRLATFLTILYLYYIINIVIILRFSLNSPVF